MDLEKQSRQLLRSEQMVRELQDRESDLLKTVEAKDTQTSLLRLRLEEADGNLKLQRLKVNDLISENDRYLLPCAFKHESIMLSMFKNSSCCSKFSF